MRTNFEYKLALGYAAACSAGWFIIAVRQWIFRQRYLAAAVQFLAQGDGDRAQLATQIAGGRLSEVIISMVITVVVAVAAVSLYRRTWHAWDVATVAIGLVAVFSTILVCASGRVIYAAPFTLYPLWILLYRPGVKEACGVGVVTAETIDTTEAGEPAIDLRQERTTLTGLEQSLRVFEIERGLDTDQFVSRYAEGLEDDSADNEEWFALAR